MAFVGVAKRCRNIQIANVILTPSTIAHATVASLPPMRREHQDKARNDKSHYRDIDDFAVRG